MLAKLEIITTTTGLDSNALKKQLSALSPDDCLAVNLEAQNAGVLIRYSRDGRIIFETFELSATSESVMSTTGRLSRTFPGHAVSIPAQTFLDRSFQQELSDLLSRLSSESVKYYQPTSIKAGTSMQELRDTTSPALVSDCLMSMLCAIGRNEEVALVQKFVREDVLWQKTLLPWRRAPFWLLLRVSILRVLICSHGTTEALKQYKLFMIRLVAQLLELASQSNTKPDVLSVIHVKLARRVHKFEQLFGPFLDPRVVAISKKARKVIDDTWISIHGKTELAQKLPTSGWEEATNLSLRGARDILCKALKPAVTFAAPKNFVPPADLRVSSSTLPSLRSDTSGKTLATMLLKIETWVEKHLAAWTNIIASDPRAQPFDDLAVLIEEYWSLAQPQYKSSPLDMSNALLTILELWVSLDKICISRIPLLARHSPEVSSDLLKPLLLHKIAQMRRLSKIEEHLNKRLRNATKGASSVFKKPSANSLPIWYYDITPELQQLRHEIDQCDISKKQRKLEELRTLTEEYDRLVSAAENEEHYYPLSRKNREFHDKKSCKKCKLEGRYARMTIDIDEKSLPNDKVQAKAAIFELAVPLGYAAWRDTTWYIVHKIGQRTSPRAEEVYNAARAYGQLRSFVKPRSRALQMTLTSRKKTFIQSHYEKVSLPTTSKTICRSNGMDYDMLDVVSSTWLSSAQSLPSLKSHCTLSLPNGSHANLQWALSSSGHTSNQVMASQSECSNNLEIREYIAFCSLRSGARLQWLNILRELGCSNLTLNDPAVASLIHQAIWEVGTPTQSDHRVAHDELRNKTFCNKLLEMLQKRLPSIESNWQEQHSMMTVIQLLLRVLSLSTDEVTKTVCHNLLSTARKITLDWCREIQVHMNNNTTREDVQGRAIVQLLNAGLSCYSTFDVDEQHLPHILGSAGNIAALAEAQIIVCDNTPIDRSTVSPLLKQSLLHHVVIAHKLESHVRDLSRTDGSGLNQAVQRIWNGAVLQQTWDVATEDAHSWLTNNTITERGRGQKVHFNLLGGDLLVDGKPVGKIPSNLRSQPLFQQIFGPAILSVFTSNMPGMDYTISQHIYEYEVHVGAENGQVLIRAKSGGRTLQALSQTTFARQLPSHFVQSFTHWLDEATGEVEFRPLEKPWQSSAEYWKLSFLSLDIANTNSQMRCGQQRLIENGSKVGQSVTDILSALDSSQHCQIILNDSRTSELKVYLRRYNLHFHVTTGGQLLSLEYSSVVDRNQNIGTMIGLCSKLVLRDVSSAQELQERRIIIPWGEVTIAKEDEHVAVSVPHGTGIKQKYFVYSIDRHLRKLRGQQDVLGTLYKAYLHAITSFALPDPFTGRTGTEESIATLKEASLFSCAPLHMEKQETLALIKCLTPERLYYPKHKTAMQTVCWHPSLSPLAQHDDFSLAASAIFAHHAQIELIYDLDQRAKVPVPSRGDAILLARARRSNASVMKSGLFSDMELSSDDDKIYCSRDHLVNNDRAKRVFEIASLIKAWPPQIATHAKLTEVVKLCPVALGAETDGLVHLRTLLAFAFSEYFAGIHPPPSETQYTLGQGSAPDVQTITRVIRLMIMEVKMALEAIREALSPCGTAASIADSADLWPRLSESCLLSQLSRNNVDRLPAHWKVPLLQLGEKMASLQRSERMALLHGASNKKALWNELKCAGRDGWTATEYPSWLLLEIENNITIRPLQAKVAKEMIAPGSGRNSVLQLNMGEGKSSVIVPMLATALAAGEKLARVVVLKPLLRQTEQVLTQRLGGLLGHRVGHVPFSRKTKIDVTTVRIIQNTFQKYAQGYGVLVALPEELLSMKLMTREKLASGSTLAAEILDMYRWLKVTARDILDESDEILSVKSQLIYTVGDQQMLDGKNDRWQIVQAVLRRVELHVKRLANAYPSELELEYSGKAFPLLKFLRSGVFDILMEFICRALTRMILACMRLRSLSNGHSLCFVAPPEVHRSIADASGGKDESQLTSFGVLAWTMEQTCQSLEIARPLRAMHGLEMSRQQKVLEKFLPETRSSNAITSKSSEMGNFWECIQEDDAQTLENLYGINDHRLEVFQGLLDRTSKCPMMQHLISEIETMSKTRLQDSSMDNEQERELEHEIETERRVQRPAKLEPIIPSVSKGILDYIASGTAFALSQCEAVNAFSCFDKTTTKIISEKQNVTAGHFRVLATLDFIHSVLFTKGSLGDDYLRPTTWVLSSTETEKLLIISPHEANELLPEIKASGKIRLHTFAARLNKRMARFNHMNFYTPNARPDDVAPAAHVIRDLELFSGSLYVDNMAKYERLCHFLGVATASTRPQNKPVQTDGFVDVKVRKEVGWPEDCPFNRSPLPFFKHILSLRMHGQAFDHSHMGAMLNGRALQEAAFEGCQEIEEIFEEMDIDD
ncbi:hypothetical protein E4T42_02630 [Aureobasidium subglaciale]|nr:hypothetical protein E4T42_02630 [Aureobasidium subglaciale]